MKISYTNLISVWGANSYNLGGFYISYGLEAGGFGTLSVVINRDGKLVCDNEIMSRDEVKAVFSDLIDRMQFKDKIEGYVENPDEQIHGKHNIFGENDDSMM